MKKRNPRGFWTFEKLRDIARLYPDQGSFKKGNKDAYNAAHRKHLMSAICPHMPAPRRSAYTLEEIQSEANKHTRRIDFKKKKESIYQAALCRDDYEQIVAHMDDSKAVAYTLEELKDIASRYSTAGEFKNSNPTAHRAACRRNDYESIIEHMQKLRNDWTLQEIIEKSDLCGTHMEFREKYPNEYQYACKNFNYAEISKHLKFSTRISKPEKYILGIVRNFIPEAKTLRDMKANIFNKPHIHGFEIDIFVPKLNKGIEYDGKWPHSVEGLKRGRPNWPAEDLKIYHELKDGYFKSKGITILHIKEDDWEKDQEACIKKCLAFLGIG